MSLHTPIAQQLAEIVSREADSGRLQRGRRYHRQGRVSAVEVSPGEVRAGVGGSGGVEYSVVISAREAPAQADDDLIVPSFTDIAFQCNCMDWGDPCKHGVAALLAFADEVDLDNELVYTWRGATDPSPTAPRPPPPPPRGAGTLAAILDNLPVTRGRALLSREVADEPLGEFFTGGVPPDGSLLGDLDLHLESLPNPLRQVRISLEHLDAAPVLADAVDTVNRFFAGN